MFLFKLAVASLRVNSLHAVPHNFRFPLGVSVCLIACKNRPVINIFCVYLMAGSGEDRIDVA